MDSPYTWHSIEHMPDTMPGLHLIREGDEELMAVVIHIDGEWLATVGHHLGSSTKLRSRSFYSQKEAIEAVNAWAAKVAAGVTDYSKVCSSPSIPCQGST
jgi:hypothetical protein